MALFGADAPKTLEDVLGQQATDAETNIDTNYAQQRKRLVGQQAHAGRLGSGVSNYNFGDLNAAEAGDIGNVQNSLAQSLGQIPLNDYADSQDFERQRQLSLLIADLSKPSALETAFGLTGDALHTAGSIAALAK